jgi:hypothetical protein
VNGRGGGDLWRNSHELGAAKGDVGFVFRPHLDFFHHLVALVVLITGIYENCTLQRSLSDKNIYTMNNRGAKPNIMGDGSF